MHANNILWVWPTPPAGQDFYRMSLDGDDYISTGWFPLGSDRKVNLCSQLTSLFFDFDLVTLARAIRISTGLTEAELGQVRDQKAWVYALDQGEQDLLFDLLERVVEQVLTEVMGMPPTLLIDSGWGLHAHYAWRGPHDARKAPDGFEARAHQALVARINKRIETIGYEQAECSIPSMLGSVAPFVWSKAADSTHDVGARVCRYPGTVNRRNPSDERDVAVRESADVWLDRARLEQLCDRLQLIPAPLPKPAPKAPPKALPKELPPPVKPGTPRGAAPSESISAVLPPGERVDFDTLVVTDGTASMTVTQWADLLAPGSKVNVVCPFGGTSKGSAFIVKDLSGLSRLTSNAQGRTYMNMLRMKPQRSRDNVVDIHVPRARTYADVPTHMQRLVEGEGKVRVPAGPLSVSRGYARMGLALIFEQDSVFDYWYDEARALTMSGDQPLQEQHEASRVGMVLESDYDFDGSKEGGFLRAEVLAACHRSKRNPVQDYLKSRHGQWDGVPRIDRWIDHVILEPGREAGVKQDVNEELISEYAKRFFIALVARAMKPGCQVDTMLILVGPEGFRKSSIFKQLMPPGLEDMYVVQSINYRNPVEGERYLARFWLVEDSEMTGAGSNEQKKSFIAASHGSIRSMHSDNVKSAPRKCVLVGTTNEYDLLTDPTGNRRYWMVPCPYHLDRPITHPSQPKANTDWLDQNLDQLYSEAVDRYAKGERWHLGVEHEQARTVDASNYRAVSDLQALADAVYARNGGGRDNGITLTEFAKVYDTSPSMTSAKINTDRHLYIHALRMAGFVIVGKHPKNKRTLWAKLVKGHTQAGMNGLYDHPSDPDMVDSSDA